MEDTTYGQGASGRRTTGCSGRRRQVGAPPLIRVLSGPRGKEPVDALARSCCHGLCRGPCSVLFAVAFGPDSTGPDRHEPHRLVAGLVAPPRGPRCGTCVFAASPPLFGGPGYRGRGSRGGRREKIGAPFLWSPACAFWR